MVRVCVPSLILFETIQDKTGGHFSNWRDRDKTACVSSSCSGNFREFNQKNLEVYQKLIFLITFGNSRVIPGLKQDWK